MDVRREPGFSLLNKVIAALAIIGAINWGLIGLFKWNLVTAIFGGDVHPAPASGFSQFIYIVVGLAGLALAFLFPWGRRVAPGVTDRGIDTRREVHP
ncbi:MAG: DUF378 domain-containing protein [Archangium sp.]